MNQKSSVVRFRNNQSQKTKKITFQISLTQKVSHAMLLIAFCSLLFGALQLIIINSYYALLYLIKNTQPNTLSTIQLRILG